MDLTREQQQVADRVIGALAGPDAALREDQLAAVTGLLQPGSRVLVVQATGWGKSAVYWVATAIRRAEGAGPTLVVSPLLSLMRDQVVAAGRAGLRAATLNSSNISEWNGIESDLRAGLVDVLLVSPERLANPGFGARVMDALSGALGLLVIDEAHAVSDWGHDFRPDYRRVADAVRRLNPDTPVLATTATANRRVTDDVAAQLGEQTLVLRGPLARSSLQLAVIDALTPLQRFAWVVQNLPALPGSGIVYALTVADAERLAAAIDHHHRGAVKVAAYTGQLEAAERERLEDALRGNEIKALVATSALGMGYDKPDLGFCVHVGAPPSPVSYYQQVGRAGRGIDHAVVMLLSSTADEGVWDYFATASIPDPAQVQRLLEVLPVRDDPAASVVTLEAESGLRRTRVELMLKQLAVDGVVERGSDGWRRTGSEWVYDGAHYESVVALRQREAAIMRDYARGRRCLMQLLQEALDDPSAAPCGRCSVCTGSLPDGLPAVPDIEVTRDVAGLLRTQKHLVEPRKMWPGGAFGSRGRIPVGEQPERGRALIFADAPEWRELVQQVFGGDDAAPPDELVHAVVALLGAWRRDWSARPEVVVGLPAAGFPVLTQGLVRRVAEVGRLGTADLSVTGDAPADATSSQEAAHWARSIGVPDPTDVAGKAVLLVTDASSSLWPVTIAASKLRSEGASSVLPLVVHRRP
jgi:ATP-dependent DNA helicase RecQ